MGVFSRNSFGASGNLNSISSWLSSPNASEESRIWNYGRYAYISLTGTGNNNAGLCNGSGAPLGDTKLSGGENYDSTIIRDGERDIPSKPILDSVRINNDGSTDMSDAALFDIDVSFKCFSKGQFETYEAVYFTPGSEVKLSFGYKGLGLGGTLIANVYNFGFSLDASGVYSCNMKLTGKNKFASILTMTNTSTSEGTESTDKEGTIFKGDTIVAELHSRFVKAFPDFEESSFIQKSSTPDFVEDGKANGKDGYIVANIQTKGGFDFKALGLNVDTDDMFVKYVTLEELVNVINWAHKGSGFSWGFGTESGKYIPQMCSADPSILLLDSEMANYGGNDDTSNNLEHGLGGTSGHHKGFAISLEHIGEQIEKLTEREKEDKEAKGETSVNNFIRNLCGTIKDLTGGLYQLTLYSDGAEYKNGGKFLIVNERAEHARGISGGFNFTLHNKGSVLTSVNMSSNMDSDMAAAALTANRSGTMPKDALEKLFPGCVGNGTTPPKPVTLDEIKEKKEILGSGFSAERVADLKSKMASYVEQQPTSTGTDTGYRYMIDLSVSHYGCWGTQPGDTFTFSGVPSKYQGAGKYFCVGQIEHSFDGQGKWDTSVTGFLKLDA
jgi:hypothetical protein